MPAAEAQRQGLEDEVEPANQEKDETSTEDELSDGDASVVGDVREN